MVVGGRRGRLDDEDILAANILIDPDKNLIVGEILHLGIRQRTIKMICNRFCERPVRITGDEFHGIAAFARITCLGLKDEGWLSRKMTLR